MNAALRLAKFLVGLAIGPMPDRTEFPAENPELRPSPANAQSTASASPPTASKPSRNDRSYDVFVSYRRDKGSEIARYVSERLVKRGYRVFLDVDSLGSGEWGKELQQRIDECPDFIAVITEGYFVRCENPEDVVRKEIIRALEMGSTVVPLFVGEGKIPTNLPSEISGVGAHNGVRYMHDYANQAIEKLCTFLQSTPLLGPERLSTGEAQPRVILLSVLFTIGAWQGGFLGDQVGYQGDWWQLPLWGVGTGLICVAGILVPVLVTLTIYGKKRGSE